MLKILQCAKQILLSQSLHLIEKDKVKNEPVDIEYI